MQHSHLPHTGLHLFFRADGYANALRQAERTEQSNNNATFQQLGRNKVGLGGRSKDHHHEIGCGWDDSKSDFSKLFNRNRAVAAIGTNGSANKFLIIQSRDRSRLCQGVSFEWELSFQQLIDNRLTSDSIS